MVAMEVPPDFEDSGPADALIDVASTWRDVVASTNVAGTATNAVRAAEQTTQTGSIGERAVQTDDPGAPTPRGAAKAAAANITEFMKKVEGMMSSELVQAVEEHEVLEPFMRQADDGVQEPAACIQYLSAFQSSDEQDLSTTQGRQNKHKLVVTCVSWSSTGQTIAAAYGRFDVVGWCTQPGLLATWNLGREEVDAGKPDTRIDTDTCLMSCAFHPVHPALIAGGTFNGELYIWDLGQDGDVQRGRSDALMEVRHTEPIVTMTWQYNIADAAKYGTKDKSYRLVTLGADGRVLIWQWHKLDSPVYAYAMLWPQPGAERKFVWGGACMSFQREPRTAAGAAGAVGRAGELLSPRSPLSGAGGEAALGTFLVGSEGGKIFKCYSDVNDLSAKDFAKSLAAGERVELRSPIRENFYTPHPGSVFGIDCSPFQRELFLTCGADGSVRLYSSLRQLPLLHLEPTSAYLYTVQWSPFRPLVFAATAADGLCYLYDLMRRRDIVKPVLTLDTNGLSRPTYALAFNPKKPDLLATGDSTGIQVWRLPSSLSGVRRGEESFLKKVAQAEDVNELLRTTA